MRLTGTIIRITGILASTAGRIAFASLAAILLLQPLLLQTAFGQMRFTYSKGQSLEPAYEGWMPNEDGSFTLYFGYMNPNWEEQFDIPIGPDNKIESGGPDQGQPTHFYPRRNPFLFTIRVPKNFGEKELTWTLTSNGKTRKAYASLKTDYQIDKQVISTEIGGDGGSLRDELRYNIPPELEIQGEARKTVKVGEALTLVALAGDPDNLPPRRDGKPQPRHAGQPVNQSEAAPSPRTARATARGGNAPPSSVVVADGPGLWVTWIVYRGKASTVTFNPELMKAWMDSRAWANSAWSPPYVIPEPPPDGKWVTQATFQEPGTYVLRAVACDGSLFTFADMIVTVTR
jgi:hypothetical protein